MTYGIIGVRQERDFKQVFGPAPIEEVIKEFKDRCAADVDAGGDGIVHGVLELFELRAARRHKIRNEGGGEESGKHPPRKRAAAEDEDEDENAHGKARKRAGH
jgi:hypothetical protein